MQLMDSLTTVVSPTSAILARVVAWMGDRGRAEEHYRIWRSHWTNEPIKGYAKAHAFETAIYWTVAAAPVLFVAALLDALLSSLVSPVRTGGIYEFSMWFVAGQVLARWVIYLSVDRSSTSRAATKVTTGVLLDVFIVLAIGLGYML